MQLDNKSGIKVVYIRQGLLSSRLGPFVPDRLTEVVRQIYHKAMRHRLTNPDLYDGTVLLSEAEDLAGALNQHTLGPPMPAMSGLRSHCALRALQSCRLLTIVPERGQVSRRATKKGAHGYADKY